MAPLPSRPGVSSPEWEASTSPSTSRSEQSHAGSANQILNADRSSPDTGLESRSCQTSTKSTQESSESISSTGATPASPSPSLGRRKESATPATSGQSSLAAFAFYDRASCCWRMSQAILFSDSSASSLILPRRGSMRAGWLYEHPTSVPPIDASGSSVLPSPAARDAKGKAPRVELTEDLQGVMSVLFPTPGANDYTGGRHEASRGGGSGLKGIEKLLPTPIAQDAASGRNSTVERRQPTPSTQAGIWKGEGLESLSDLAFRGAFTDQPSDVGSVSSESPLPDQLMIEGV